MVTVEQNLPAEGLMGVKIIPKQGVVAAGIALALGGQPAFGGGDFAVLFVVPVLRNNKFRSQWHHLFVRGAHDHRRDGTVIMGAFPILVFDA